MLDDVFRSFARPPGPGRELLDLIIGRGSSTVLRDATDLCAEALASSANGLTEVLRRWSDPSGYSLWHPAISDLKRRLKNGEREFPLRRLVEIGVMAQLGGIAGNWSFRFSNPTLLWIDKFLFAEVMSGNVECNGTELHLDLSYAIGSRDSVTLRRSPAGRWTSLCAARNEIAVLPAVEIDAAHCIFVVPGEIADEELLPQYPGAAFKLVGDLEKFSSCLAESIKLIATYAPEYVEWVAEVIRFVAPINAPSNVIGSSSSPKFTGLISISDDSRPISVAEFLVHEASHQYFFLASSLGEVDAAQEEELFYSRFARRRRPLERILVAYHALGNMALFYERCMARGFSCERRLAYVATHMRELNETLRKANTLTSLGRGLGEPLEAKTSHLNMVADERISDAVLAEADRAMVMQKR